MQNPFFRYNQGQGYDNNVNDQGTWQQPMGLQGQEDTYYTGSGGGSTNYYTNQQSSVSSTASMSGSGAAFSTGVGSFKSKSSMNNGLGSGSSQSQFGTQQGGNMSNFMSNQMSLQDTRSMAKIGGSNQEDGDGGYYGFPNESYMTNSSGSMMGMNSGNSGGMGSTGNTMGMGNMMGMGTSGNSMGMGNSGNSAGLGNSINSMGMGSSDNFNMNMMGNYGTDTTGMSNDNSMSMDNSGGFGSQLQNQIMAAAVGMGAFGNWQNNFGNAGGFNMAGMGNFNKKGKKGKMFNSNRFKGTDMYYQPYGNQSSGGYNNLTVHLNATNHNQWCFLRKNFNKRDNDLAEHLFDIHEKFCHQCKDRIEERKSGKKRKVSEDESSVTVQPQAEEEEAEEELTEEELEMRKLMGFSGFRTTKGSRVQDNNYSTMASVNAENAENVEGSTEDAAEDATTTLTDAEKKMLASVGGFSVFSKTEGTSGPVGFGAPAVTFDTEESNGPGYSNEPLYPTKGEGEEKEESQEADKK